MENKFTEKEIKTIINECSNCGAQLNFDILSGKLKCTHCGNTKDIEKDDNLIRRQITNDLIKKNNKWNETSIYTCDNCGAKEVISKKEASRKCCFCGSVSVVESKELAGIKPDAVIPFQITKDTALKNFHKWIKSRWLAPNILKSADIRENINPIYTSCWSFSAETRNLYIGVIGRNITVKTRNAQGNMVFSTKTEWSSVSGNINENYFDYLIQSGEKISPIVFNKLQPFNLKLLSAYKQEYLTGNIVEHYSRDLEICFNDFSSFIKGDIRRKIIARHNADVVKTLNIDTEYIDKKFNYILLPIYISNYSFNKKTFNFYVNGVSGLIYGKYPKSKLKIFFISFFTAAAIIGSLVASYFII